MVNGLDRSQPGGSRDLAFAPPGWPRPDKHAHTVLGTQGDTSDGRRRPSSKLKPKTRQELHQHGSDFQHRETHPNAASGAAAERQISELVSRLRGFWTEAIRVEQIRLIPQFSVAMDRIDRNNDGTSAGDIDIADLSLAHRRPEQPRDRGIKPQRLADHLAGVGQ